LIHARAQRERQAKLDPSSKDACNRPLLLPPSGAINGQISEVGDAFDEFALTVLPTPCVLGAFTFIRVVECGAEDFRLLTRRTGGIDPMFPSAQSA
jgi:hypothetical protein